MKYFFYILAVLSFLYGILVVAGAKSAIHEIEAGVSFVVFVISLGFGCVLDRLKREYKDQDEKTCPYCLEYIKDGATVCKYCGKDLPEETKHESDYRSWGPQKTSFMWGSVKECPFCGKMINIQNEICPKCGWKPSKKPRAEEWIELKPFPYEGAMAQLKACPKCGGLHQMDATKCGGCGWEPKNS